MAEITASMVKELRDRTGLGMMDCKKAGNIAADGAIIIAQGEGRALLLEVNSQTDFVAKDENFTVFANKVAEIALANNTADVAAISALPYGNGETIEEARVALVQKIGENIQIRRAVLVEGATLATYRHGLKIGVVVAYTGGDAETGKGIAMHVAAFNPLAINAEDVPADVLEREKEIFAAKARESGKPENIVEKMITGSLDKYLNEVTLTRQMYVIDNEKKVGDVLKAAGQTVNTIVRLEVGEGIEKKVDNFAEEVAAATAAASAAAAG